MQPLHAVLRSAAWLVGLTLIAGMGWLGWQGCRPMPTIIVERRVPYGIDYDADYEAKLNSGQSMPVFAKQVLELNRQYDDTLSQPIAITSWRGDVSTWEVFFATNRGVIPATAASGQVRFGNQVLLQSPHFGRAQIALPWRRRGVDPQREEIHREQPSPGNTGPENTASFEQVCTLSWEALAQGLRSQVSRARQHDLLLFVHGFNVDFESALLRTTQIAFDMPFNGAIVAYSWPSQGGVLNYQADEPINAASVAPFAQFLEKLVAAVPSGTRINIVVHSMGNRLVMPAIGRLPRSPSEKPIANLVLCAPDVGLADFQHWAPEVAARCQRVTLYASRSDSALIVSKHVHSEQRAGDAHPPVCLPDIETIDVSAVDFDLLLGHSYFGSNLNLLSDLYFVVKEHRPAAERRYLSRASHGPGGAHYWQFSDQAPYIRCSWKFGEAISR